VHFYVANDYVQLNVVD